MLGIIMYCESKDANKLKGNQLLTLGEENLIMQSFLEDVFGRDIMEKFKYRLVQSTPMMHQLQ
jgi:hypothetical protein